MNDNEIIGALENSIPVAEENGEDIVAEILRGVFGLINRQKTDIEVLKEELADARYLNTVAKSDGIKEFVERLKERGTPVDGGKGFEGVNFMCSNLVIDDLAEEMIGEANGEEIF